jgi:oligoribonuclease NrnB/cAMP/cGMP phosphodiesterase (DHH superfamily)
VKCDIVDFERIYMLKIESVCLSHKEDPDGVISAVLIKQLFNSNVFLTDYGDLMSTLQSIIKNYTFKQIFICDLALKFSNVDEFFKLLSIIKQNGVKIWFIDHHMLPDELKKKFEELDATLLHLETECTSAIIYKNFKDNLKKNAELLVACACITDGMENGNIAQKVLKNNEKMFTLLNSALIWYGVRQNQNKLKELQKILNSLSSGKLPFEIITKIDSFHNLLSDEVKLNEHVESVTKHYKSFDCLKIHDGKLSNFATRLLSRSEKAICLVHRDFDNGSVQELVILSSKKNKNLGLITNILSGKFHGSGGGDPQKSAAIIPTKNFDNFLSALDLELES